MKRLKQPVSKEIIDKILRRCFGAGTRAIKTVPVKGGLFNTSYKVYFKGGAAAILRIAPPKDRILLGYERSLLEREIYFLALLRRQGLPVPKLLFQDLTRDIIDRDYVVLEYREGYNAFYRLKGLARGEQELLFGELGEYARRIHSITNKEGWFGPPAPFRQCKSWSEFINSYALSLYRDLRSHTPLSLPKHISIPAILNKMKATLDEITIPKLVHGDLWLRNILIDKNDHHISAILDWDRGLWGDPFFEWILYGMDLRPSFWQKYGSVNKNDPSYNKRFLLYRACGCLQAGLEDHIHFNLKKNSARMLAHAADNFSELLKKL